MTDFNVVITRIRDSALLVVPFSEALEFGHRRAFSDSEFLLFLRHLGLENDGALSIMERSRPAPKSFTLHLALSSEQFKYAHSQFVSAA